MDRIQDVIFRNIISNEDYARAVTPHLKEEYFEHTDRDIFNVLNQFVTKFNKMPTLEVLEVGINKLELNEKQAEHIYDTVDTIKQGESKCDTDWLIKETEQFCQDKALFNAITESVEIYDGSSKLDKGIIPKLVEDALSVAFNTDIGLSFKDDAEKRFNLYHTLEERLPFTIDILNAITRGGVPKKTLNLVMGDTNVGKSLILCFLAGMYLKLGYNVLHITMEMGETAVYERIDAHLLDINIEDLYKLTKKEFLGRVRDITEKSAGELIVKEFPTAGAHVGHFRHLINELKTKKDFKPDVIIIDYLNICQSFRYRDSSVNSYSFVKSIAEEVRGLGVEFDVPVWSATQSGRTGNGNIDLQLNDISESYGTAQTVDLLLAVMALPDREDRYLFSQLKSRYTKKKIFPRFTLGVNYEKMMLFEPDDIEQTELHENRKNNRVPEEKKDEPAVVPATRQRKLDVTQWEIE